jgi:hypothetical protein
MGYSTDFIGSFHLEPELTARQLKTLEKFCSEVHDDDDSPGGYCQWIPTDDGQGIEWDGGEKFNDYIAWLEYLIDTFFTPWGITVNGTVMYQGEEIGDSGKIYVKDSKVIQKEAEVDDDDSVSVPQEELEWMIRNLEPLVEPVEKKLKTTVLHDILGKLLEWNGE